MFHPDMAHCEVCEVVEYYPTIIDYPNNPKKFIEDLKKHGITPATVSTLKSYESTIMKLKESRSPSKYIIIDSIPQSFV